MRAFVLIPLLFLVTGCAAGRYWQPETLDANTIEIRFLSEKDWWAFRRDRADCDEEDPWGCLPSDAEGVANWSGDTCIIWFPAHRGIPTYGTLIHEIRHCYQGHHVDWQ